MTIPANIPIPPDALEAFCQKWRVRELSLFGSVLRDDFGPDSDVDVLVSFDEDAPWSLWDLIGMQDELAELFGRRVDLVEKEVTEPISAPADLGSQTSDLWGQTRVTLRLSCASTRSKLTRSRLESEDLLGGLNEGVFLHHRKSRPCAGTPRERGITRTSAVAFESGLARKISEPNWSTCVQASEVLL